MVFLKTTEKDVDNKSEIMLNTELIKIRLNLTWEAESRYARGWQAR